MAGLYHWSISKIKYELKGDMFLQGVRLKHAIPTRWKTLISNYSDVDEKTLYQNQHVIKGARILCADKLSSKEINQTSISKNCLKTQL